MRDGRVQQIGPPGEVYARPANRFVAGFVGTPPMNMIEGRLHRHADGTQRFAREGIALDLPPGRAADATPGPVVAGVRPDRIALGAHAARMPWRGEAFVERAEAFGDRTEVHLRIAECALLARVDGSAMLAEGASVAIGLDPADLHLFAADDASLRID
jgi:multiple sugar transport system ATP-binding protein